LQHYHPKATTMLRCREVTLSAINRLSQCSK
jgi:hypothetical protein